MSERVGAPVIAVVGATGLVGNEMLVILEERNVPCSELRLLASQDSEGEVFRFHDDEVVVRTLNESSFDGVDFALFGTSAELSEKFVPVAVEAGAIVVDNSSRFRMDPKVPLVVPEINLSAIRKEDRIIANPNCSTIQLVVALRVLHELAGLKHVVVSTYQSVSGAGKAALDELWAQTLAVFNQKEMPQEVFGRQIAFNCIPQIDLMLDNGYSKEEWKIIQESRKILGLPDLRITATAVRVPVFYAHAESVFVETERPVTPEAFVAALRNAPGISAESDLPLQIEVSGQDDILVGRIRADLTVPNGLSFWVVADNVRKGAALNAVQIVEELLKRSA